MMRIGVDGRKIPEAGKRGPIGSLKHGKQLGMAGLFFRTVLDMSPKLDSAELKDIRDCADDLGMYLETGLGKVNPYATPEAPELRAIGNGDILAGFRRRWRLAPRSGVASCGLPPPTTSPPIAAGWPMIASAPT
jgi:hypothetical protein